MEQHIFYFHSQHYFFSHTQVSNYISVFPVSNYPFFGYKGDSVDYVLIIRLSHPVELKTPIPHFLIPSYYKPERILICVNTSVTRKSAYIFFFFFITYYYELVPLPKIKNVNQRDDVTELQ